MSIIGTTRRALALAAALAVVGCKPEPEPKKPAISVSPATVDFGSPRKGELVTRTLTVTNTGTAPLDLTSVGPSLTTSDDYSVAALDAGAMTAIPAGASLEFELRYRPSGVAQGGTLAVESSLGTTQVPLTATVVGTSELALLDGPEDIST